MISVDLQGTMKEGIKALLIKDKPASQPKEALRVLHVIQSRKGDIYLLLICVLDISLLCYLLFIWDFRILDRQTAALSFSSLPKLHKTALSQSPSLVEENR